MSARAREQFVHESESDRLGMAPLLDVASQELLDVASQESGCNGCVTAKKGM